MSGSLSLIYGDEFLRYDFGDAHSLQQARVLLSFELMKRLGLTEDSGVRLEGVEMASDEDLLLFHTKAYLDFVRRRCATGEGMLDQGDTPAFPGGYEAAALIAGSTLKAVRLVWSGETAHAFNLGGGLHHAHPDRASGFCIFNDLAVALAHLRQREGVQRLAYIDIDVHHGDGVMYGFYGDPGLLDIDFHEDGRYLFPGTGCLTETGEVLGRGYKINLPFPPDTSDPSYLYAFQEIAMPALRAYRPQLILVQCGADARLGDPLADLRLSTTPYETIIDSLHRLAHEICDGKLVLTGGGGYNPANVAQTWTVIAAAVSGFYLPELTPPDWQTLFRNVTGMPAPTHLRSGPVAGPPGQDAHTLVGYLKRSLPLLAQGPGGFAAAFG